MRRLVICALALLVVGAASAQTQEQAVEEQITHGEFAVLLMKVVAFQETIPGPDQALTAVKRLGLIPPDWNTQDVLTHGEFADVIVPLGIQYVPVDRDQPASREFVEALLRREIWKLRDYLIAVWGSPRPIISTSQF